MIITLIIIALTTTPSLLQANPQPLGPTATLKVLQGTVRRQLTEDLKRKVYIEDSKGTRFVLCSGEVSRKLVYYVGFTLNISYQTSFEQPTTKDSSCLKVEQVVFLKLPGGSPVVQGTLQKDPKKKAYFIKNNNPSSLSALPKGPQVYFFSQLSPQLLTWFEKKRPVILDVAPDINKEGFYKIKAYYSDPLLIKEKLPTQ